MALGVSVASATDPVVQWKGNDGAQNPVTLTGTTWGTSSGYKQLQVNGSAVENIIMTFLPDSTENTSSNAPVITQDGSITTKINNQFSTIQGYLIQQGGQAGTGKPELTLTTGSSASAGIMLGTNGEGNLYLNFIQLTQDATASSDGNWGDGTNKTQIRKMILDLSSATTTQYSLVGNIIVDAGRAKAIYGENAFEATFGKGMKGDLVLRKNQVNTAYYDLISKVVFLNGSSIEGDVSIDVGQDPSTIAGITGTKAPYSGNNFVFRKDSSGNVGGIIGTLTITGGYTRLYHEANDVIISDQTAITLGGGTLIFDNYQNIGTVLGSSFENSSITSNSIKFLNPNNFVVNGGTVTFNKYNQVIFGNNNNGTLRVAGTLNFILSPTAQSSQENPTIKGNIAINRGNILFSLSDTSGVTSDELAKTYYIDGDLSITNGKISAFWDDTSGFFTGKIASTSTGRVIITDGFVGKNDAWFDSGTFSSSKGNTELVTIKTTSGTSHLRFSDAVTVSKGIGSNGGNGVGTDVYFYGSATIGAFDSSTKIDDASVGKALYAKRRATNTIHFAENSTINGDIYASLADWDDIPVNTIIASKNLTLGSSSNPTMTISIDDRDNRDGGGAKNLFDITGDTTIASNLIIQADSRPNGATVPNYRTLAMQNIFKFGGSVTLNSGIVISELNAKVANLGRNGGNTYNILSFESNAEQNVTIGVINKSSFIDNKDSAYNYIGKGYTTNSGTSLTLNSNLFNSTGVDGKFWDDATHQANVNLTVTNDILAKGGANYINVKSLSAGSITSSESGRNFINTLTFSSGDITTNSSKNTGSKTQVVAQTITLNGDINTGFGDVYLHSTQTAALKNISATDSVYQGAGVNNIILEGTSATIGEDANLANITLQMNVDSSVSYGHNAIVANATTNTFKLNAMRVQGYLNSEKTHNIISFNASSGNTFSATSITSAAGYTIIGKNIVDNSGQYSSDLFNNISSRTPDVKSNLTNLVLTNTYMANVDLVLNNTTNDALVANGSGNNYLNTTSVTITGNVKGNGGSNFIRTQNFSVTGDFVSNHATNYLYTSDSAILGNITTTTATSTSNGGISYLVLNGTSASIGTQDAKANITTDMAVGENTDTIYGHTTIVANADTNTLKLGTISISGFYGSDVQTKNFNILSFNKTGAINSLSATSITSGYGNAIVGKNIATESGHNSNLFTSANTKFPVISTTFATTFMTDAYMADVSFELNNGAENAIIVTEGGANYINVKSLSVTGNVIATGGGTNNFALGTSGVVNGNITASGASSANKFTLLADNASLTLQGAESTITTLTAFDGATNGNTLTLDATNNESVIATITTLNNGDDLKVNFAGIDDEKITQLTLNTANVTNLKSVSVTSGLNNTLALTGTGTMSIAEAVSIGETSGTALKGVIFDLTSGADLTFAKGLTTNTKGVTTFKLGVENVIAVSSGDFTNNGIHNFDLNSTTGTTTFKYGSGLAFSSGVNNINFNADNITLNWQGASDTTNHAITTSGASTVTNLNFNNSGTLASGISTTDGTTNIKIADGKTATISGAIATSGGAQTNVLFKGAEGATTRADEYSILKLGGATNAISSVTSDANGVILLKNTSGATIDATIDETTINKSLIFAFEGAGASEVDVSKQGITVGKGATLGISLAGTGATATKTINGNIDLQEGGSTLIVDFQASNTANGAIGGGAINIKNGSFSVINFHAGNQGSLTNGDITVKSGGTNTVNFYGDASLSGVVFESGAKSIINVYDGTDQDATEAVVNVSQVEGVTNTITLYDYATLSLGSGGTDTLTSSTLGNTLNFKGNGGILKGGFGATGSGSATINVGNVDYGNNLVKGTITGKVDNATLVFNAKYSVLELQSTTNTFKSIDSQAQYGIVALNTANNNVDVIITDKTSIDAEKSLIFSFDGNNDSTVTTNGNLTVAGTLGVIINGDGNKKITGDVDLGGSGTLLVEFASGDGTATLGGVDNSGKAKKISIKNGESSIINFRGTGKASLANAISLDGGTSTINFYRSGTVGGITLNSGTSIINVEGESTNGYNVKLDGVGEVGNVANIINLGEKANFNVVGTQGGADGSGTLTSSSSTKASELNFVGDDATFQGGFGASDNGVATINIDATGASITGNVAKSSLTFGSNGGALTLKGTTNTLTTINTTSGNRVVRQGRMARVVSNTLTLDTTAGNNETKVSGVLNAQALTVNLNTTGASHIATLELNGGSLGTINVVDGDKDKNTLNLRGGTTTIDTFSGNDKGLKINLDGGNLTISQALTADGSETTPSSGVNNLTADVSIGNNSTLSFGGATNKVNALSTVSGNGIVSGGIITANTLDIASGSSLAVRNATATFTTVSGDGTLTLDGANAGANVEVTATRVDGNNITANFNGNATGGNTLVLSDTTTLADITFGANSTNNTISVASGKTLTVAKAEGVAVGSGNEVVFSLANTSTLSFTGGMTSAGNSTISVDSTGGENRATLSGGDIKVSNVNLSRSSGTDASSLTLNADSTDIATLTASAGGSNTLIIDGASRLSGNTSATLHTIDGILNVKMNGDTDKVATLNLNGGSIASVSATSGDASENIINFKSGTTTIDTISGNGLGMALNLKGGNLILSQGITADGSAIQPSGNNITVDVSIDGGSTLSLAGENNAIHSLSGNGVVDLAMGDFTRNTVTRAVTPRTFKTLTIANYSGNDTFNIYVDPKHPDSNDYKADQVNITDTNSSGVATFTVTGNIDDILGITYNSQKPDDPNNVKVGNIKGNATVAGGDSLIGYDIIQAQVFKDASTGNVYLGQAISKGVAQEIKDVASSALTVNYDLFLANFNSLNKRMGELRDNPYAQGVWTRVFGGAMSNDFGAGSKTQYVTAQAGYDYSLTLGDANNYMGIAVAYGHSTTKSNTLNIQASQGATIALQDVKSNMVEVGIYNSYVMDSGWYNDTIFKFDYIMSSFTMTDNLSLESETNNFAMVLSDEFGYRYKFAENEKGNWYIDPQVEVAFGYFNQSDFNRAMLATNSTLEASQDNILTLRTRAGLSLGKKFNTAKGFASLYVGAFYEYDYINGGDAEVLSKSGIANPLDKLESNGRAIVNVGSNIELTEGVRMYIDVEKSFGDKQRTDMQFNFGARYSFGEKTPTLSYQEQQKKRVAPLKVEEKQEATQATSEQEAKK